MKNAVMNLLKKMLWPILFLLMLALRALLTARQVEWGYSRVFYPPVRWVQGLLSSLSPVALIYVFLLGILLYLYGRWRKKGWKGLVWALFSTAFFVAFSFLALWGLNYQRVPFQKEVGLAAHPLPEDALEDEFNWALSQLLESRLQMGLPMDQPIQDFSSFSRLDRYLLPRLKSVMRSWGYPVAGRVRARLLYPKGILLRFSSSGVYLPWTGEGHVDAGLYPLNWPFVMTHELAHGYGIANEGVCNFLAYQVCSSDPDPYIRYAGLLYYWRYTVFEVRRFCPMEVDAAILGLPEGIQLDLQAIRENSLKYPDFIPQWRDVVYNSFLKSQGLKEGIMSYETVLMLAHAYRVGEQGKGR